MRENVAKVVSIVGHPFLTIPLYTLIVSFSVFGTRKAMFVSLVILGVFFVPISLWNYIKTKKGSYTNFDVSDRKQRNSMYIFAIPMLTIVLAIFYFTNQPKTLLTTILFALLLLLVSFIINLFLKCSGHASLTIFLCFLVVPLSFAAASALMASSILIGWSRIVLKRHTLNEVLVGILLGLVSGVSMLYFQGYFK